MRSTLAVLFLALFATACTCIGNVPSTPSSAPVSAEDLTSMTVALTARDEDGETHAYCTGVWVGETAILTAAHCVSDEDSPRVTFLEHGDSKTLAREASIVGIDLHHDLALLRTLPNGAHAFARVSAAPLQAGARVFTMGHSMGLWWSYSSGDLAAIRTLDLGDGDRLWVQSTAPISPGNSGGGLFDSSGDIVGLASGSMRLGQNLNLYVHPSYIAAFLKRQGLS